ncbi:MAG: OmpA family protein [Myxococcales bacterium]|nr:OmpA family protein [Myxococcales bacterium]
MHRIAPYLAVLICVYLPSRVVRGQNVDVKVFDPVASPYGLLNVHASKPLDHLGFYLALTTNYANDLLVGLTTDPLATEQTTTRPVAHRITMELAATLGILGWGEVGFALPFFLSQQSSRSPFDNGASFVDRRGLGDLRLWAKARFLKGKRFLGFGLGLVAEVGFPTGRKNAFMTSGGFSFIPRLIIDWRHSRGYLIAINIAYKLQKKQVIGDLIVDDELRLGLGAEVPLSFHGLSLIAEVNSAISVLERGANKKTLDNVPIEITGAIRWRHRSGFLLTVGTGFGISRGYAAPDIRAILAFGWGLGFERPTAPTVSKPKLVVVNVVEKPKSNRNLRRDGLVDREVKPQTFEPYRPLPRVLFDKVTISDPDPDGDGIPNSRDKCPNEAEDFDGFEDEDGCPDPDNDKDGIPDHLDKCPNEPETINGIDDDDGCPDQGPKQVQLVGTKIKIQQKIFFAAASDKIDPKSYGILKQVAAFMKQQFHIRRVLVEGHTDSGGDKDMNVDLSERRALSVMQFLVKEGVAAHRLEAKGFGPKRPLADNATKQGRAQNRRVEFTIVRVARILAPRPTSKTPAPQPKAPTPTKLKAPPKPSPAPKPKPTPPTKKTP